MKIGVQLDLAHGFARRVLEGILAYKKTNGHWRLLVNPYVQPCLASPEYSVDAICILHDKSLGAYVPSSINRVLYAGSLWAADYEVSLSPDNREVGRMAADSFQRAGFKDVALLTVAGMPYLKARADAFCECAHASALKLHPLVRPDGTFFNPQSASDLVSWVSFLPKPIAIFATSDIWALRVLTACEQAGLDVPHEVAILGVDNDELLCEAGQVPLSSIDHGAFRMGWESAATLVQWVETDRRPDPPKRIIPPPGIQARASTDLVAVRDGAVSKAMHYIRQHMRLSPSVDDVVAKSGVNRRTLERRFQSLLGRSIHHEIQMTKMDTARAMLRGSSLPVSEVAEQTGFGSAADFSHVFKRYTKMSPSEYRRSR